GVNETTGTLRLGGESRSGNFDYAPPLLRVIATCVASHAPEKTSTVLSKACRVFVLGGLHYSENCLSLSIEISKHKKKSGHALLKHCWRLAVRVRGDTCEKKAAGSCNWFLARLELVRQAVAFQTVTFEVARSLSEVAVAHPISRSHRRISRGQVLVR